MQKRIVELEDRLATMPAAVSGEVGPASPDELAETLGMTLPGISAGLEFLYGKEMALAKDEQQAIAKALAGPMAPAWGMAKARIPWVPAVLVIAGIMVPKLFEVAARKKKEAAESIDTAPPSGNPAPGEPVRSLAVVRGGAPTPDQPMQYGGPAE